MSTSKNCKQCAAPFEITTDDLAFYDKISPTFAGKKFPIPAPTLCPQCRWQRRLAFRNERHLYHRKCDFTGKQIISMYAPDAPFPVYSPEIWFSDKWDARQFGKAFDFNKTFTEQFLELQKRAPRLSLISQANENCDYCNIVGNSKNCYLIFGSILCEDCYYGNPFQSKNCIDSLLVRNSELCCECTDSDYLYGCYHCQDCSNSRDLLFCFGVKNSANCFGCSDVNRKEYCIFNEQVTQEQYQQFLNQLKLGNPETLKWIQQKFQEIKFKKPKKVSIGYSNENVSGNYITHSKNCSRVFHVDGCQDLSYGYQILKVNDGMDLSCGEEGELLYEQSGFYEVKNSAFCHWVWNSSHDIYYCSTSENIRNCFACVGLRNAEYCILNVQYTKEEYEILVPQIIEHMKKTKFSEQSEREGEAPSRRNQAGWRGRREPLISEWGEFFPVQLSPFAYNETLAQELFPMNKEKALAQGFRWREDDDENSYQGAIAQVPEDIEKATIEITKTILKCETTGKLYKIIPQEFEFYKKMKWPIPRRCPDQRHKDRFSLRNPYHLWERMCAKCANSIQTTYAPDCPEKVYCESCYLKEVY